MGTGNSREVFRIFETTTGFVRVHRHSSSDGHIYRIYSDDNWFKPRGEKEEDLLNLLNTLDSFFRGEDTPPELEEERQK